MSLFQWIRFGWLYQKMIRLGYCPLHNLPFHDGYERDRECVSCIRARVRKKRLAGLAREAKRESERTAVFLEMLALSKSPLPPATPECGDVDETDGARRTKSWPQDATATDAARKEK